MALFLESTIDSTNVNGSSGSHFRDKPEDGSSWLAAWKKFKGFNEATVIRCANQNCPNGHPCATDGAHIRKTNNVDKSIYIVPLCHQCNCSKEPLSLDEEDLVPLSML